MQRSKKETLGIKLVQNEWNIAIKLPCVHYNLAPYTLHSKIQLAMNCGEQN